MSGSADLYELARKRAIRERLKLARAAARQQLAEQGYRVTWATVDDFLCANWYRLPEEVAELLWRARERRERVECRRSADRLRLEMAAAIVAAEGRRPSSQQVGQALARRWYRLPDCVAKRVLPSGRG